MPSRLPPLNLGTRRAVTHCRIALWCMSSEWPNSEQWVMHIYIHMATCFSFCLFYNIGIIIIYIYVIKQLLYMCTYTHTNTSVSTYIHTYFIEISFTGNVFFSCLSIVQNKVITRFWVTQSKCLKLSHYSLI